MTERKILAKVTRPLDVPRGPDALHELSVPKDWLDAGAAIEFELPRNLSCAVCKGGGCDTCERAGAVSTRGRKEPAELVSMQLPDRFDSDTDEPASDRAGVVVRLPERGGLPSDPELPRGNLMVAIRVAAEPGPGIQLAEAEDSRVSVRPPSIGPQPEVAAGFRYWWLVAVVVGLLLLWLVLRS